MITVALLAVLQIILESFPVSSSGNSAVLIHFLNTYGISTVPLDHDFDFFLHGSMVLIVLIYFFSYVKQHFIKKGKTVSVAFPLVVSCFIADCITALWYLFFMCVNRNCTPLYVGFLISTGALFSLWWVEKFQKKQIVGLSFSVRHAVILGMVQGLALIPGVSRFAVTFVAARWLGHQNFQSFFLSFLIELPLIFAACVKGTYGICVSGVATKLLSPLFLLLILIATVISGWGFSKVGQVIERNRMHIFGWYTLVMAVITWCFCL